MPSSVSMQQTALDLEVLPDFARQELFEFYEFLVFKYQWYGRNVADKLPTQTYSQPSGSKWARLVQRIANDPAHLNGYAETLKHDFQEFREHFEFSHDHES